MSKNKRTHSKNKAEKPVETEAAVHEHEHEHHDHDDHCGCEHKHEHHDNDDHCGCEHKHEHHNHDDHCGCEHKHEHYDHGDHCCDHDHEHHDDDHCGCEHKHEHHHEHHHHDEKQLPAGAVEQVFLLDELDCPNCAAKIEDALSKTEGILYAEINLLSQQLTVAADDHFSGDLYETALKTVKRYEPEVDLIDTRKKEGGEGEKPSLLKRLTSEKAMYFRFGIGAVLYASGLIASHLGAPLFVYLPLLVAAYSVLGFDVLVGAVTGIIRGRVFDEKFLMTVSTVGAFVIGEYPEAVAVMLFYQIGEFFQSLAVKRSRRSISELMDIRPDSACVLREGKEETVAPDTVRVGEIIVVRPGEKIPLDGIVTEGEALLDTRALTGESLPRQAKAGDEVLSGCISETGLIRIKTTKRFGESTASRILELVENAAGRKAPTENFISRFARVYTPAVVIAAALLGVVPPLVIGGGWAMWIRRCFTFLVISCPCALVVSIPLTFFGGIGAASRRGVLVKGSNYLEALSRVDTVVFDKTGTLTKGKFTVTKLLPADGVTESELLMKAAAAESFSNHPIARSICAAFTGDSLPEVKSFRELAGGGVSAQLDGAELLAGSARLMKERSIDFEPTNEPGTVVYTALGGKYLGALVIADEPKPDSAETITKLHELGVEKTVMLTGDVEAAAKAAAQAIGVEEYHSGLLPGDKVDIVEKLAESDERTNGKLVFVGDGINDAPVLARADVGIAMGALGSDAAIEAADVVLMNDTPSSLIDAIKTAKRTKRIVTQNIVLVLAVKAIILVLGALGIAGMWMAVFGDVGVMILAVLNSMRILANRKS